MNSQASPTSMGKNREPFLLYLKHLDTIFQKEPDFFSFGSKDKIKSPIISIIYKDIPEKGFITGLTFGLSMANHPEWKFGRPELMICVESPNVEWAHSIAFLVSKYRMKSLFSYGEVFDLEATISDDSRMEGFFIFAPPIFEKKDYLDIDVGDYKINIAGAYPIYKNEMELVKKNGFQILWDSDAYNIYSVTRNDLSK